MRIFCLPFAGGSERAFDGWSALLPPEFPVTPIGLPGRGGRYRERPVDCCAQLVALLLRELRGEWSEPYVLFGHSMGALVAYELARHAARGGARPPACVFVSGQAPPHLPRRAGAGPLRHELPEEEFVQWLKRINPAEARSFDSPVLARWLLPTVRADVRLVETHVHDPDPALGVPLVVYGGKDDAVAPPDKTERWGDLAPVRRQRTFDGGHFFIKECAGTVLRALAEDLRSLVAEAA